MEFTQEQKNTKRMIVILKEDFTNHHALANKIHEIAAERDFSVLFLVFVGRQENLLSASRNMVAMKAITAAGQLEVTVETKLIDDWLATMKQTVKPDDVIFCQEEQTVFNDRFHPVGLSTFLKSKFSNPVEELAISYTPVRKVIWRWTLGLGKLLGFLIIIGLFTWLEINLETSLTGSLYTIYMIFTFSFELGAILLWNKLLYR